MNRTDVINKIGNNNTEAYKNTIASIKLEAGELTIEDAMRLGNQISKILKAIDDLGRLLGVVEDYR